MSILSHKVKMSEEGEATKYVAIRKVRGIRRRDIDDRDIFIASSIDLGALLGTNLNDFVSRTKKRSSK